MRAFVPAESREDGGRLGAALTMAFFCLAFLGFIAFSPANHAHLFVLLLLLLPAISLAYMGSRHLLPYILFVWIFGAEIRRITDWIQGSYTNISILSVAPLLVTLTLIIALLRRPLVLALPLQRALCCFLLAFVYGAILGLPGNGLAALYEFGYYAIPLLFALFMAMRPAVARERDRVLTFLVHCAILVAAYGWAQFLLAPAWDTFWMKSIAAGSFGLPEPGKIRVFSTTNAPGTAAGVLGMALVLMLAEKRWRGAFGWAGVALVLSALALTMVRAMVFLVPLFLFVTILLAPGRRRWRVAFGVLGVGIVAYISFPYLPGAGAVMQRMETLTRLDEDRSLTLRRQSLPMLFEALLRQPYGHGLGSTGTSFKLNRDTRAGELGVVDNGFLAILLTFGLPGGLLFFLGMGLLWRVLRSSARSLPDLGAHARLAQANLFFFLGLYLFGNPMPNFVGVLFWLLTALALGRPQPEAGAAEAPAQRIPARRERARTLTP